MKNQKYHKLLLVVWIAALILSAIHPHDYLTWILEVFPAVIGVIILVCTYRRLTFSNFVYTLILVHSLVLMYGGHYTYALAPLGDWMQIWFGFARNNYDKVGHLMQGVTPVLVAREYFIRRSIVLNRKWLPWILVSISGAISALYEIFEWLVSVLTGSAGDSFLGTQGYIWDTQSDMLYCLIGAFLAIVFLSRLHDRSMSKLDLQSNKKES